MDKLTFQKIAEERNQDHSTRKDLYEKIEAKLGKPVVAFFTSFVYPVSIESSDEDMIEAVFQKINLSKGLILLLNSPGGDALAAEGIINICRTYSGTKGYEVIVPNKAKSAATMICLGADKIIMSPTSELDSVDPQRVEREENKTRWFSIFNLIRSYEKLFKEAITTQGRLEPFMQQLSFYDPREIEELKAVLSLSEDITIKALKTRMFEGFTEEQIKEKIKKFLIPEESVKIHGRAIYADDVKKCGLNVDILDPKDEIWCIIYELYTRLNGFVSFQNIVKCVESKEYSFHASALLK